MSTARAMRQLFWRFYWADGWCSLPGLYFWAGLRRGAVRLWGFDLFLQIAIVGYTVPGVWLAGSAGDQVRQGFWLLLLGQPFWLLATWRARHYGGFVVSIIYTALWLRAVINSF